MISGLVSAIRGASGAPALPELGVIRILVVDDDPQARVLIEMALAEARFRPVLDVAANLRAGLDRIRQDEHDVYLIDQHLPDGTGVDLITEARTHGAHKPFILMTGYGSLALDEEALDAGASDYLAKPVNTEQLLSALRSWLHR